LEYHSTAQLDHTDPYGTAGGKAPPMDAMGMPMGPNYQDPMDFSMPMSPDPNMPAAMST